MNQLFDAYWKYHNDEERELTQLHIHFLEIEKDAIRNAWMSNRKVNETTINEFETWFHETYERER